MKTCVYARRSTLKQTQKETIENQIKICKRYANEHGLDIVDIKTDSATGTDDLHRPEVRELIQKAIDGEYDCVIMKGVSRLYRNVEAGLSLIKKLDRSKIRVITVEEMFDSKEQRTGTGKLDLSRITMYLMFSEMESKKFADRVKYTQLEKAHEGQWNQPNNVPYGYEYDKTTKKLIVDHSKVKTIKLIFDLYLNGMGVKSIAHYLNGDNEENKQYPSPKLKRWSEYTVNYILKNEVYTGTVIYNRRSKTERPYKNPEALGKTIDDIYVGHEMNPEDKWVVVENAHEPIISNEIFNKAQEIMSVKSKRKGIRNNVSLFASIAKCGNCGSGMTFKRGNRDKTGRVRSKDNYYCMNYIRYGKQYCNSLHISAKDLEEFVVENLMEFYNDKSKLKKIAAKLSSSIPSSQTKYAKELDEVEKQISNTTNLMDRLLMKNMEGDIDDNQYKMMNRNYSEKLNTLIGQKEELVIKIDNSNDSDKELKNFEKKIMEVGNYWDKSHEEKRYDLLSLIKSVTVNDRGDHVGLDIVYKFE